MSGTVTLITTEIEETWPATGDVLFLGEWCRLYSRTNKWAQLGGAVVPYHWNDRKKLKSDYIYLESVKSRLLIDLANELNALHGASLDLKQWKLLCGYWVNIYVNVLFDRWSSVNSAVKKYPKLRTIIIESSDEMLDTNDTADFILQASESSYWNHALFGILLKQRPEVSVTYTNKINKTRAPQKRELAGYLTKALKAMLAIASSAILPWKKEDSFFFAATYMSFWNILQLELKLGQIPNLYLKIPPNSVTVSNGALREWRLPRLETNDDFESALRTLAPKLIPKIFVEGFRKLQLDIEKMRWPRRPKLIWTSNYHFGNEIFCAWAGERCRHGTRLAIGEHGGICLAAFNSAHSYELSIADLYFSTGWRGVNNSNINPIGNFRRGHSNELKLRNRAKGVLLVNGNMPRYGIHVQSAMLSSQVLEYLEDQFVFYDALPRDIQNEVTVRPYSKDYGWTIKTRWLDRFPHVRFDDGRKKFLRSLKRYCLFVGTYNATSYLETLSLNFPTVVYWNPCRWEVKPGAKVLFEKLRDVGIFHEDPKSAAEHVAKIWSDIPGWWQTDSVQGSRSFFCEAVVASRLNIVDTVKDKLLEESSRVAFPVKQ